MRFRIRSVAISLLWVIGLPGVVAAVGVASGWSPWVIAALAAAASFWAWHGKPAASIELHPADENGGDARLLVVRRGRRRDYRLSDLSVIAVNTFRVSVPVTYLSFADGVSVGPMLTSDAGMAFLQQLIRELRRAGRDRDSVFWSHVEALERYFRHIDSKARRAG